MPAVQPDVKMDGEVTQRPWLFDQDLEQASYLRNPLVEGIPKIQSDL